MTTPKFPIEISVEKVPSMTRLGDEVQLRATTRCNGVEIGYLNVLPAYMGKDIFEYSISQEKVFVKNHEVFNILVEQAKDALMRQVSEAYYPRFSVGG